jgi:hypothetical protein
MNKCKNRRWPMSPEKEMKERTPSILEGTRTELERTYIREYLQGKGYRIEDLRKLPRETARQLMSAACIYASGKLAEIESRAKFREEIHIP